MGTSTFSSGSQINFFCLRWKMPVLNWMCFHFQVQVLYSGFQLLWWNKVPSLPFIVLFDILFSLWLFFWHGRGGQVRFQGLPYLCYGGGLHAFTFLESVCDVVIYTFCNQKLQFNESLVVYNISYLFLWLLENHFGEMFKALSLTRNQLYCPPPYATDECWCEEIEF